MIEPDFEAAQAYALQALSSRLPPGLCYHNVAHTRDYVVPTTAWLIKEENVAELDGKLLITAAWFHDIGFIIRYKENEVVSVKICKEILPGFGFNQEQIEIIAGIIMATRLPQTPHTFLEEMMDDADLDVLGRDDFWVINLALRTEMAAFVKPVSDEQWYSQQLDFLHSHRYFTKTSREYRQAGKLRNVAAVQAMLDRIQGK